MGGLPLYCFPSAPGPRPPSREEIAEERRRERVRMRPHRHDHRRYSTEAWLKGHGLTLALFEAYAPTTCDFCGEPLRHAPNGRRLYAIDHDHAHCPGPTGCLACIRGVLCARCNNTEYAIRALAELGLITVNEPAASYWAHPPFQRWLAER